MKLSKNLDINFKRYQHIISFNYTKTHEILYGENPECNYDYIHGIADKERSKEEKNIVLGIDEYLTDNKNDNVEFIDYKKYYQRIYKKTGCKYKRWLYNKEGESILCGKISIFGYSLDFSDRDIIKELVCYDEEYAQIEIYYLNKEDLARKIRNLVKVITQNELIRRGNDSKIVFIGQYVNNKNVYGINWNKGSDYAYRKANIKPLISV